MQPCESYKSCSECLIGQVCLSDLSDLGGSKAVPNRPSVPRWPKVMPNGSNMPKWA